jgi:hypothetical protein
MRTAHAVVGVLVLMTSVVLALKVWRLAWLARGQSRPARVLFGVHERVSISGGAG